jgi:hypothetical protein
MGMNKLIGGKKLRTSGNLLISPVAWLDYRVRGEPFGYAQERLVEP